MKFGNNAPTSIPSFAHPAKILAQFPVAIPQSAPLLASSCRIDNPLRVTRLLKADCYTASQLAVNI